MQNELRDPMTNWTASSRGKSELSKTHEGWYNMPGTGNHEMNMNVSLPKARLSSSHKLSTKQGIFLGAGGVALIVIIFIVCHRLRK